jgi:poly(3-hydroxybutyrate) depolymerase
MSATARRGRRGLVAAAMTALAAAPGPARDAGAAPDSAPAANVAAWAHEIDGYYDAWRFAEADRGLAALEKAAPTAPQVPYLQGYQRFLRGDYDGAVRALAAATTAAPNNADARSLAALAK